MLLTTRVGCLTPGCGTWRRCGWSRGERLRFLWYRVRPMVAEMNYATRRMVQLPVPWISGDSPLNPRQHLAATSQQEPAAQPRPAAPMTYRRPRPDRCAARPLAAPLRCFPDEARAADRPKF
jgi:hypothetical protein